MTDIPKLDLNSMSITEEKISRLKEIMPEIFTVGAKTDFEKLKLAPKDREKNRIWPGRRYNAYLFG